MCRACFLLAKCDLAHVAPDQSRLLVRAIVVAALAISTDFSDANFCWYVRKRNRGERCEVFSLLAGLEMHFSCVKTRAQPNWLGSVKLADETCGRFIYLLMRANDAMRSLTIRCY